MDEFAKSDENREVWRLSGCSGENGITSALCPVRPT